MNHQVSTHVTSVTSESRSERLSRRPILTASLRETEARLEVVVGKEPWCRVQDTVTTHHERVERAEAAPGRWPGVVALGALGVSAGYVALTEKQDRSQMAFTALLYSSLAFVVYYVPLAREFEKREVVPPKTSEGWARVETCGSEPFAGARVELRLLDGEALRGVADERGVVRFEGVGADRVRNVIVGDTVVEVRAASE